MASTIVVRTVSGERVDVDVENLSTCTVWRFKEMVGPQHMYSKIGDGQMS